MNTNSKRLIAFLVAALLTTSVATTLRSIACLTDLDYASGFFTSKALISISNVIMALTVVGAFVYMFASSRINIRADFTTSSTYVPTGILGVATAFIGARVLSHSIITSKYPILSIETFTFKSPAALVGVAVAILAFLSILHHFFNAFITEAKSEIRAYFSIATIAFLSLYSVLIYLDSTLSIGDGSKTLRLTAFLLSALFFLYEARISLGREMWRVYTAFGLAASSISAYVSIPAIITYYSNGHILSSAGSSSLVSLEEYVLLFALFVFISARLCLVVSLKEEKENELINTLKSYATEHELKTNESFERYQELFASKQLSIFDLYGGEIPVNDEEESEEIIPTQIEEKKEHTISDDAIYEAIFGKMPERVSDEEQVKAEESLDEREPEKIAEDILNAVDEALSESKKEDKKEI